MTDVLAARAATVPARYVREAVAHLRLPAPRRAALLRNAGMPAALLGRSALRCTPEQFATLCRAAVRATDDEAFGYLARPVPRGAFAVLLRSLTRCPDLGTCLDEAFAFYGLFDRRAGWALVVDGGRAVIRLVTATPAQAGSLFYANSALLTGWRAFAWLAGRALPLDGLGLPAGMQAFAAETRYLFGAAPDVAAQPVLRFPASWLRLPVVRAPEDVAAYRRVALAGVLLGPPGDPIEERVRRCLASARPFASAAVDAVARRLGMSRPTLARHLQRLGTSFAALRDELRRDHAVTLLLRTRLSVAEVAERLGYSEPSAFQRAFKGWTGVPPRRYVASARATRPPRS